MSSIQLPICTCSLIAIIISQCCLKAGEAEVCSDKNVAYIAKYLVISYEVIANLGSNVSCRLNLTNSGRGSVIGSGNWEIYFSHTRLINLTSISADTGLKVSHVNGVLHKFEPLSRFSIDPGQTNSVYFVSSDWIVSRTDVMPNWYVATRNCTDAKVIPSTAWENLNFVAPFKTNQQWKRTSADLYDPYTPQERYTLNYVNVQNDMSSVVIPRLHSFIKSNQTVDLRSGEWVVFNPTDASLLFEANYLAAHLEVDLKPSSINPGIYLSIDAAMNSSSLPISNSEANYLVTVTGNNITIVGQGSCGVFHGVQTLLSLFDSGDGKIPSGTIQDGPRFDYRGMFIDVARNFHTTDDMMRLLDAMALYKLNNLHLHLGDDEGWRLEIPEIPELTKVGGNRCHDTTGDQCIMPQLGSSPNRPNLGSGYYSVGEYQSILKYANDRHIRVIPEFDMPGHAHAAINSMLARHRKYSNMSDATKAKEFLLTDFSDSSVYISVQGFTDNAINPCVNSTYNFVKTVLDSVKSTHNETQPLTLYHIGGDEVSPDAWLGSKLCKDQFGEKVTNSMVKEHFIERISNITTIANVSQVVWEDGVSSDENYTSRSNLQTFSNVWNNVWGWGREKTAYTLANRGYKVILSHATHLYFDFPYEPDPEERGYYWATRLIPTKKVFSYLPDSVYDNIDMDVDRMGYANDRTKICGSDNSDCPPLEKDKIQNIVGMQGQVWSETVRTSSDLDYMIYPRLLALAERAWHKAQWESENDLKARKAALDVDWENFANAVGSNELKRLDWIGIEYRVPPPGVSFDQSTRQISVTSGLPGLKIRYSKNLAEGWTTISNGNTLSSDPTGGILYFATWSFDGRRSSRIISVVIPPISASEATSSSTASLFLISFIIYFYFLPGMSTIIYS